MNRARMIVKKIDVEQSGQVIYFDIRLPKNALKIVGMETDVYIFSPFKPGDEPSSSGSQQTQTGQGGGTQEQNNGGLGYGPNGGQNPQTGLVEPTIIDRTPFPKWDSRTSLSLGKLKVKSLDRSGIFYDVWVPLVYYGASIPDMGFGIFSKCPFTLNTKNQPEKLYEECTHGSLEGKYEDTFGIYQAKDMRYRICIYLWLETDEDAAGKQYEFQQPDRGNASGGVELQFKV